MANINSSIFSLPLKICTCTSTVCGVTALPITFNTASENDLQEKPLIPQKKEEKLEIKFENYSKGVSLGLKNVNTLLEKAKEKGQKVTFREVGIKWGDKELSESDILASPCQNGDFYWMKFAGNNQYKLEDGRTVFRTPRCGETYQYKHLNYVNLKWRVHGRMGNASLTSFVLGSCDFTRINDSSFSIMCYQNYIRGRKSGESAQGILTINKST